MPKFLPKPPRGWTADDVTTALREAILDGTLPPGEWLREADLATSLEVSRTPVREALRRLADEQLTERVANRGSRVRGLTLEDAVAVYVVREALEGLAARCAASLQPPGLVDTLRSLHEQMTAGNVPASEQATLNLEFHRALRDASGNAYLSLFLTQVEHAVRRFGTSSFANEVRVVEIHDEHVLIIDAIEAGDPDAAEAAAVNHMREAREARVQHIVRALQGP